MKAERSIQVLDRMTRMLEHAANFPGRPRERLVAVTEAFDLFRRLHPCHARALSLIRLASQLAHAEANPPQRLEPDLLGHLIDIIRAGIASRDLRLSSPRRAEELAFSLWALAFGTRALLDSPSVRSFRIDTRAASCEFLDLLLDSLGWKPLSDDCNYAATRRKARRLLLRAERS
jgi:hypothetical protein